MSLEKRTPIETFNGFAECAPGATLQQRVKSYCQWCVGEDSKALDCLTKFCPLFPYRTGRGPRRPRTPSQLAAATKNTEALRASRQKKQRV